MIRTTIMCLIGGMLLLSACGSGSGPTQEQEDCYARSISAARVATLRQAELWDNEIDDVTALATIMEVEALLAEEGETFTAWLLDRFPDADDDTLDELISIAACFGSDGVHDWMSATSITAAPVAAPTTTTDPCGAYVAETDRFIDELNDVIIDATAIIGPVSQRIDDLASDSSLRQSIAADLQPLAERARLVRSEVQDLGTDEIGAHIFLIRAADSEVRTLERLIEALDESRASDISTGFGEAAAFGESMERHVSDFGDSLDNGCRRPEVSADMASTADQPWTAATTCSRDVWYFVDGTTEHASTVTLSNSHGDIEQLTDVRVPVGIGDDEGIHLGTMSCGAFVSISAQNGRGSGKIECRIEADGVIIHYAASQGAYVIASCSGEVR